MVMKASLKRDIFILLALAGVTLWYTCMQDFLPVYGAIALLLGLTALPLIYRVAKNITAWFIPEKQTQIPGKGDLR